MTPAARLFWGSLVGALFVLFLHPVSRPFFSLFFDKLGPSKVLSGSPLRIANVTRIAPPTSRQEAAFYLVIAARQFSQSHELTSREASFAASIAIQCAQDDRENAFWPQMAATFLRQVGKSEAAMSNWMQAGRAARWDDGQNGRLLSLASLLETEYGATLAWQTAALIDERSDSHAFAIESTSRSLRPNLLSDVEPRLAALNNGQLILEGGRSIDVASAGTQVMQDACSLDDSVGAASYAERLRQRQRFLNELRRQNRNEDAAGAESVFRNADSWSNLVDTTGNREDRRNRQLFAALAASIPGPLVYLAALGALVMGAAKLVSFYKISHRVFSYPFAPLLGLFVGTAVYATTFLVWPALWGVLSLAFFVFQPSAIRSQPPTGLTGQHRILVAVVGSLMALCFIAFVMGLGAPMRALVSGFGVPMEYQAGSSLLLGLCLLMLSILVFSAPVWAMIVRHDPVQLLRVTLHELGRGMLITGLLGSVIATPICVWLDRSVADPLSRTLLNEPNLYLSE